MVWERPCKASLFCTIYLDASWQQSHAARQIGCASNCLFVAQPTAGLADKVLPPEDEKFQKSSVVAFTGRNRSLKTAKWAECNRELCHKCALNRKRACAAFEDVEVDTQRIKNEIPQQGTPAVFESCCCELQDCGALATQFHWPASIPSVQGEDTANARAESEAESENSDEERGVEALMPEQMVASDNQHNDDPLSCFAVFRKKVEVMQNTFAKAKKRA